MVELNSDEKSDIFVIALCGGKGHGKDTVGNWCVENLGAVRLAFGEPLKRGVQQFLDLSNDQVTDEKEKEKIDPYWNHAPREFYQIFGTELAQKELPKFLQNMDNKIWVKCVARRMARIYRTRPNVYNIFVITDVRLKHEEDFVKSFPNHLIIRVNRNLHINGNFNNHISETAVNSLNPCYIIENNGTIQNLYRQVEFITTTKKLRKLRFCDRLFLKIVRGLDMAKSYKKVLQYLTLENLIE